MNKNISCVFLLTTLILFLGLSVVCASDINSCAYDSVSDLEKVNNIKDNTVNKITDNNDNNIKEIKKNTDNKKFTVSNLDNKRKETSNSKVETNNVEYNTLKTVNKKNLKSSDSYTVTNDTFSNYFSNKKLNDNIQDGSTLDFKGLFNGSKYSMTINRPVNLISSDKSAFIDLDGGEFVIEKTSHVNVTNITFHNSQTYVRESSNVTFNRLNILIENKSIGQGVGSTSIRDGSTNITIKNSNFYTENSGGYSTLVFAGVNCSTIENNTITAVGEVGNLLYLTTFNTNDYGIGMNSYNIIRNNRITGPSSASGICYAVCLTGHDNLILNNTIVYPGSGITIQWGYTGATVGNTFINNTITGSFQASINSTVTGNNISGGVSSKGNTTFTNNTLGSISLVGNDVVNNNIINGYVTISKSNNTVDNNLIKGDISASGTPTYNTITNNNYTGTIDSKLTNPANNNVVSDNNQVKFTEIIVEPSTVTVPIKTTTRLSLYVLSENNKVRSGTLIIKGENGNIIERASLDDKEIVEIDLLYDSIGVKTLNITYEGVDNYLSSSRLFNIIVIKQDPSIEVITTKSRIDDLTTFKAKFNAENVQGRVIFKVNGKILKDENGNIIFSTVTNNEAIVENIKVNSKWYTPHTTVTAIYSGNDMYNTSTKSVPFEVTQRESKIELEAQQATIGKTVTLKAKITDATNESITINNGQAIFKLNGRTLKDTNGNIIYAKIVNGEAILDYTIPLTFKSGEYKLTCVFGHKIYERMDGNTTLTIVKE